MATTETKRFRLRERLHDLMEEEHVTTLMDSLPPIGWERLATKDDLAALEERLDTRFERIDARIDKRIAQQTYVTLVGVAAMITPIYLALFSGGAG